MEQICFISLGCDKNLVDSEKMISLLDQAQYEMTDDPASADIIVVNTCCFIDSAKEESINMLIEMGEYKKLGSAHYLIAAGCLAQRYADEIKESLPEVDAIIGTTAFSAIAEVIEELKAGDGEVRLRIADADADQELKTTRSITTPGGYYEFLKIAEGCDKHCTYCVIPKVRGRYRSYPMEDLLEEARILAEKGVKELIIVAQETTRYGVDQTGERLLPTLLKELCAIDGLEWIRLLYCYPEEITDELIEVIATQEKIVHYLDIPIQHCNDRILKRMGRRVGKKDIIDTIQRLRQRIPDICLRTTLITGFPSETDEEHEELLEFVREMNFERLGCFTYSQEEGTPAAGFEEQIDEEIKERRRDEIMTLQRELAFAKAASMVGRKLRVLIEARLVGEDTYVGRTYGDAPDVDGLIFVESDEEIISGTFVDVTVTDSSDYDLIGELQ